MRDSFTVCHPAINMIYFIAVTGAVIFLMHPVLAGISFAAALAYAVYLKGGKAVCKSLGFVLPAMVLAAGINALFNHQGATVLGRLFGRPVTLEALSYGLTASAVLGAVLLWFSCYNVIMTSDKFIYLFGRAFPSLSLILSMVFRFVPRYEAQVKKIHEAQEGIGKGGASEKKRDRMKNGVRILSVMMTWALENSVHTAVSMRSRGHGLKHRTHYSNYRFTCRDAGLAAALAVLLAAVLAAWIAGILRAEFYPAFAVNPAGPRELACYAAYTALCLLPLLLNLKEEITWRLLRSKS